MYEQVLTMYCLLIIFYVFIDLINYIAIFIFPKYMDALLLSMIELSFI